MQLGTIEASPLRVNVLDGHFNGRATITDFRNLSADGIVDSLSLREAVREYTPRKMIWDGFASGPVHAEAVLRGRKEIQASARLTILPGKPGVPVSGKVNVTYRSQSKMATLGPSILETPTTKIGFAGTLGERLHVKAESTRLEDFLAGLTLVSSHPSKELPFALVNGSAKFDGDVIGHPRTPRFAGLTFLRNFTFLGRRFDRFEGDIDAASNGLRITQATVWRAKSVASFSVAMGLHDWEVAANEPVSAKVDIRRADARMLLAMAGESQVPITGVVAAHADISGSLDNPRAAADLTVAKGSAYGESFDQLEARLLYTSRMIEWSAARVTSGSAKLNSKGSFEHPPGDFREGLIRLQLTGNRIPIGQVKAIKQRLPEISGMLEISASGSIELRPPAARPRILLSVLDANVSVEAVKLSRETLGTVSLTTVTQNSLLRFQLRSSLAGAKVQGNGQWRLENDYPIKAQIEFSPVRFSTLARLLGHPGVLHDIDGTLAGRASVAGPVLQAETLTGSLEVSKFEVFPAVEIGAAKPIAIHAAAPFSVMLQRSTLRLSEARFVGPSTNLVAQGTLGGRDSDPLNLRVRGAVGLAILTYFHPDWDVTGEALLDAAIRGPLKRPGINGQLDLKKAALSIPQLPNSLSNVNGVIHFDGQQATIEKLAGELGGGEISFSGSVLYGGTEMLFRLHADVKQARIDYPPGASALVNATLDLAGTTRSSLLSGGVTIAAVTFGPHTDLGSLLTRDAQPARVEAPVTGIASTMRLDVHIRTSPEVQFQMPLTESLAADANLQLRGVMASPGLLGRISITQGKITFFGNTYTVDQGSISFFNPNAVEPILNLDLQTRVAGIDVILTLSGPMRQLQMSYRSEPPLSFTDIVTLLATGQPPTAQAALLANQPVIPGQTLQPQLGLPTLLTQLVANPVSGRLRRVFGITALSVNPEISQPGGLARVTLQQQITKNVTFTYATDLSATNPQIVRVDWAFNPSWSVVMTRDEAGIVGVDFRYRRSFR
jgi:translocation and assembly module TamB